MALPNPRPMIEVAIVGLFGGGTQAHKPASVATNEGTGEKPRWRYTTVAGCSQEPARSLSYGYALTRGAEPCSTCWAPA